MMFLVTLVIRWSGGRLAARGAKILLAIIAAAMVIAAVVAFIAHRDARMIDTHDAKQDAAVLQGARDADVAADTAAAPREAQHAAQAATTQGAVRDATQAHPIDAARPSGPAVAAAVDELRKRRAARDH